MTDHLESKIEVKDTPNGKGLFYIGDRIIEIGEIVFKETPFFKHPNFSTIKGITDCASYAYYFFHSDESMQKELQKFTANPSKECKFNIWNTYKEDIKILSILLKDKISGDDKEVNTKILEEIIRSALNRLSANAIFVQSVGDELNQVPFEWGFFKYATRMNHSCDPNIEIEQFKYDKVENGGFCGEKSGERTFKALKPIKKGDELNFIYASKDELNLNYGFTCKCRSCCVDKGKRKSKKRKSKKRKSKKRTSKKRTSKKRTSKKRTSKKRTSKKRTSKK